MLLIANFVIVDLPHLPQSNEAATNYARSGGALLDSIIQTGEIDFEAAKKAASPNVLAALEEGLAAKGKPHQVAAKEFGLACGEYIA